MNTQFYLQCLNSNGLNSGDLVGSYNFANQVGSTILNDLYPTGECYFVSGENNVFYADKFNLNIFSGSEIFTGAFTGGFSGKHFLLLQNYPPDSGFSILLDVSLKDCNTEYPKVIVSSVTGSDLSSGFLIGINQANRLFLETLENGRSKTYTSKIKINKNNILAFEKAGDFFFIKKYDVVNSKVQSDVFEVENYNNFSQFVIGKSFANYSGFRGNLNHLFLSNASGVNSQDPNCYECAFSTGFLFHQETGTGAFSEIDPISYFNLEISGTGITGYSDILKFDQVTQTYQIIKTGVTGSFLSGLLLTGNSVEVTGYFTRDVISNQINQSKRSIYSDIITINFISSVESGDLLEIYDFSQENLNLNLDRNNLLTEHLAVFSNGMLLIGGLDYELLGNGTITGGFDSSDEIVINQINKPLQYLLYSGLHENYRQITGSGALTGYYPPTSQFSETGDGNVTITGFDSLFFNGFKLSGYDLFMNGQKIYSGIDYATGITGGKESLIIYASNFNDAKLAITTGVTGELISVDESTESILAFCPIQDQKFNRIIDFRSSDLTSYVISGKSEEIWVNGIKFIKNIDYGRVTDCSSYNYSFNFQALNNIFANYNDTYFI